MTLITMLSLFPFGNTARRGEQRLHTPEGAVERRPSNYDETRRRCMTGKRSLATARCANTTDVTVAVNLGRENDLRGGHQERWTQELGLGNADRLMVDLSAIKGVGSPVEPKERAGWDGWIRIYALNMPRPVIHHLGDEWPSDFHETIHYDATCLESIL